MKPCRRLPTILSVLLLVALALLAPAQAGAAPADPPPAPATVRVGVFAQSIPAMAANSHGFYADAGLTVQYQQVGSSTQQFQALRDDQYDVVLTSPDNVANYRLNASNPLGATIDAQAFLGLDGGQNLRLVARPGIASPRDLAGKKLAVDAPNSGFAYVLYAIMQKYGLERDRDYTVVPVGGVFQRYNGLLAGDVDATLLSNGFETRAANAGYPQLDPVTAIANPYLGLVAAAKQSWLDRNAAVAQRFTNAYMRAVRWSFDPANREAALGLLMTQPGVDRGLAEQLYAIQLDPAIGNIRDGDIDRRGLLNVLELRARFNGFDSPQILPYLVSPASGLYTERFQRAAR